MARALCVLVAVFAVFACFVAQSAEWINYSRSSVVSQIDVQGESVWVGTSNGNGAARIDSWGHVAFYVPSDGLVSDSVTALCCDPLSVWFGTEEGVSVFNGERWKTYNMSNSGLVADTVTAIAVDSRDLCKYIGTEAGFSVYDGVEWRSYTPYNSDLASAYVSALCVDEDADELWVGTDFGISVLELGTGFWRQYKVQHGLVSNRVTCIVKDGLGNHWIGTFEGVSRFDGSNWDSYTVLNGRLPSDAVRDLAVCPDGSVWVATDRGLARLSDSESIFYDRAGYSGAGLLSDNILSVACGPDGTVWVGTDVGLLAFDGEAFRAYLSDGLASNYVNSVTAEGRTTYWFGTEDSGASRFDGSRWETFDPTNSTLPGFRVADITSHTEAGRCYRWFGSAGGIGSEGIAIYDGLQWYSSGALYPPTRMLVEFVDPDPSVPDDEYWNKWICTDGLGVALTSGTTVAFPIVNYTQANSGLLSDSVFCVAIDDTHRKWFGTSGGVSIFDPSNPSDGWSSITMLNGLPSNLVRAIDFGADGSVWFGTDNGVAVRRNGVWTIYGHVDASSPVLSEVINDLAVEQVDSTCIRWFATPGGLLKYDGAGWEVFKESNSPLLSNDIRAIAIDDAGTKWLGTAGGVASIDSLGNFWVTEATVSGLASNDVRDVAIDSDGKVWFGTDDGISVYDGVEWTHYSVAGLGLCSDVINSIAFDRVGKAWVGTENGVCVLDGGVVVQNYNTGNSGLASDLISSIVIDRNGHKWFGTPAGISKFDGVRWRTYTASTTAGGLASDNILRLYIDSEYNIWACTDQGVSRYDGAEWGRFGADSGPLGCQVNCVIEDCYGGLWFGTLRGPVLYQLGRWSLYSGLGLCSNLVNDLKIDGAGKVWVATDRGVSVYEGGQWRSFSRAAGGLSHDVVNRILIDSDDNKWFGTAGGGVSVYLENHDPGLSGHYVTPAAGTLDTQFEYSVYFYDPDVEVAPVGYSVEAWVYIDGERYEMSLASGVPNNGRYSLTTGGLPVGQHTYYFYFVKPSGNIAKLPPAGVFSGPVVDDTPPESTAYPDAANSPYASGNPLIIHYVARDDESGIASVSLFVRLPGGDWEDTGLKSSRPNGTFSYIGPYYAKYEFCSIATNNAGLTEALPSEADCTVILDLMWPSSRITAESGVARNNPVMRLPFEAWDEESGVEYVEMWYQHEDDERPSLHPVRFYQESGQFLFTATKQGWYQFWTVATDKAGNRQPDTYAQYYAVYRSYDATPPESSCSTVEFAGTYFGVDYNSYERQSYLKSVSLYYRFNSGEYIHYATKGAFQGTFDFVAPQDGVYQFYTIATDGAGNVEAPPLVADATCISDVTAPEATATCKEATNQPSIEITFSAKDETSGVGKVTLWSKFEDGCWMETPLSTLFLDGVFDYKFELGEGRYYFAAVATDFCGNSDTPTGEGDCSTYYETKLPVSRCTSPLDASSVPVIVEYTASDEGSGLAKVTLFYRYNEGEWTETDFEPLGTLEGGSFSFLPLEGGGYYEFVTIAEDRAGNQELWTGLADCSTTLDLKPPTSRALAPRTASASPFKVRFEAKDDASGISSVELWYSFEGSGFERFGTVSGEESGFFEFEARRGHGHYSFYTIASDNSGRRESAPAVSDASVEFESDSAALSLLEDEHDFGLVLVSESETWTLRVANTGDTRKRVLGVGADCEAFVVSGPADGVIEPGGVLDIPVTFAPASVGEFEGTVTIETDDDAAGELLARVVGEGTDSLPPKVELASSGASFGPGQRAIVSGAVCNPGRNRAADLYIALRVPDSEVLYFYPSWGTVPEPIRVQLGEHCKLGPATIIDLIVNDSLEKGSYAVFGALVSPGTRYELLSDISVVEIEIK